MMENINVGSVVRLQAESHPLAFTGTFYSEEEYVLHLIHVKAYEFATELTHRSIVLDLGCNNGYGTAAIARSAAHVVGLDVSASALEDARRRYGHTRVEFRQFSGEVIPFEAETFDMVVSFQVIEHIENTKPYLTEITRVLKPGGIALFTTPNAAIRLDPGMKPWNVFHVREFRAAELVDVLSAAFGVVEIRGLFAIDRTYTVEFERCQASLAAARERLMPPPKGSGVSATDQKARNIVKSMLPSPLVEMLRGVLGSKGEALKRKQPLPASVLAKYTTNDLFYEDFDLDRALDLMAICRKRC